MKIFTQMGHFSTWSNENIMRRYSSLFSFKVSDVYKMKCLQYYDSIVLNSTVQRHFEMLTKILTALFITLLVATFGK
jgi:hypothetical protein